MKKFMSAVIMVALVITFSVTAFAADPREFVPSMEFNVTYQGTNAGHNADAAYGPDQYLLNVSTSRYVTFTVIHNDPIGNANGPSSEDGRGDGGFNLSIDNLQTGSYTCFDYFSQYTVYLPAGFHLVSVGSKRYADYDATYTIKAS